MKLNFDFQVLSGPNGPKWSKSLVQVVQTGAKIFDGLFPINSRRVFFGTHCRCLIKSLDVVSDSVHKARPLC